MVPFAWIANAFHGAHDFIFAQVLAGITIGLYLLQLAFHDVENYLAIIATNTYGAHSYIWNVFTAGFFNDNIAMVSIMRIPKRREAKSTRL
jgi:hypothetical protein